MGWKQPYYWVGKDGGYKVGTIACTSDDNITSSLRRSYLMKHSHTGELEWVHMEQLHSYPSSPIPSPGE